jgi:cytochrome b6-f complex iron-sulfur subunit
MAETPRLPSANDSWQRALATRANGGVGPPRDAAASRRPAGVSRRRFLLGTFVATVGGALAVATGTLLDFLYPRGVRRAGGPVAAGNLLDYPVGGAPVLNANGHFYLVNLDPAATATNGGAGGEGLLALWRKCPHLGCAVPWNAAFHFEDAEGWFRCPCHQSTYTKAGIRVFGPAPRSMDTMLIEVAADGSIVVHTDKITRGGDDNPTRAVPAVPAPERPPEA